MTRGLLEDKIDVALVLLEGAVASVLQGNPLQIVKVYVKSPLIWGIHVAANSELNAIEDVRGKRYAISRTGSGSHLIAIVDAAERGWETEDMEFVPVGGLAGARSALPSGEADIFLWERFTTQTYVDQGEFRRVGERQVPWPAFVAASHENTVAHRGEEIRHVFEVVDRECESLMRRSDAVELISSRYGLERSETQSWFEHVEWNLRFDKPVEDLNRVIGYLEKVDIVETEGAIPDRVWANLTASDS